MTIRISYQKGSGPEYEPLPTGMGTEELPMGLEKNNLFDELKSYRLIF